MDTTSIRTTTTEVVPTTRAERALRFFEERGDEIRRVGEDLYLVPRSAGSGHGFYCVEYGEPESCDCPDHTIRNATCKHLMAVGLSRAVRRGGVKTIRTLAVAAGDPFKAASTAACVGCGESFARRNLVTVHDGRHDGLAFFDGDKVCRPCARRNGVEF